MKTCWIFALLCCSLPALALSGGMERATVYSMHKVQCMDNLPNTRPGVLNTLVGAPGDGGGGDCVEYEIRTEKVSYLIRPRRSILLLVGGNVTIKLAGGELLLRATEVPKEIRCAVVAMSLRTAAEAAERRDRNRPFPMRCYEAGHEIPCID